jgi:hypothetical protein
MEEAVNTKYRIGEVYKKLKSHALLLGTILNTRRISFFFA